jgi:glycosyltransferase involved in cell wall biosynthesis
VVLTYHTKFDIDISNAIRGRLVQEGALRALLLNIRACDEVWAVSEGAGENLRKLGYEGDYVVMRNGVDMPLGPADEKDVSEATDGFDLPAGVPVYLFVGRMMWYKGVRIILDALTRLSREGRDFRMVFIGGGQDAEEIKAYNTKLKLDDKVMFLGPVYDRTELSAWYCRADLFLFPSNFDTNGLVVREAAACSLPSVLISGSCAAEGVTHGRNGFLIDESAASLAVMLATAGSDIQRLKKVGKTAADELYISWPQAIDKAIERYQVVIDRYKQGLYPKKTKPLDEYLKFQGTLMDVISSSSKLIDIPKNAPKLLAEGIRSFVDTYL